MSKKPSADVTFEVTLPGEIASCYTIAALQEYVHQAVAHWSSSYDPYEPLFDLSTKNVKVKHVSRKKKVRP